MKINQFWLRCTGLIGALGGLILFVGDMLLYYDESSVFLKQNMGNASDFRITASAVSTLFATWFYIIGLVQVYYAFKTVNPILRNAVIILFGAVLITFGIVHGEYIAIATSAKLSIQHNINIEIATSLASKINQTLRLFVYPFVAVLSFLFFSAVLKRKTLYPRWIVFFFPLIPFLIQNYVTKYLPNNLWIIIDGGYLNLILIVFFLASTISLWNTKTV
ncbi:hypothetical protein KO566_12530 [Flavobacteriaceae bacterium XHP0103]|uniref:DUF6796 family protein n=1 Tax=Marixanthotalea marina TaxID=2844359 RepID=UPI002989AA5F|nr:DUF6796 family protein [Marixanthotalea marina]MBU3822891.1 hypothetical protein [Marixanthotalea marina]